MFKAGLAAVSCEAAPPDDAPTAANLAPYQPGTQAKIYAQETQCEWAMTGRANRSARETVIAGCAEGHLGTGFIAREERWSQATATKISITAPSKISLSF